MKKSKTILLSLVAVLTLMLAACGKQSQSDKKHEQASFKNEPTSTKSDDVKSTLESRGNLWYAAGGINTKSASGMEAFHFDKATKRVTIYNIDKFYKSYSAAKKANALAVEGTVRYAYKTNGKNQTVVKFAGTLSDIPMTQTMTFKGTTTGTNKATKIGLSGYKVNRTVDGDTMGVVFVRAD